MVASSNTKTVFEITYCVCGYHVFHHWERKTQMRNTDTHLQSRNQRWLQDVLKYLEYRCVLVVLPELTDLYCIVVEGKHYSPGVQNLYKTFCVFSFHCFIQPQNILTTKISRFMVFCVSVCTCPAWNLGNWRLYRTSFIGMRSFMRGSCTNSITSGENAWGREKMTELPAVSEWKLHPSCHNYPMFNRLSKCGLSQCPLCKLRGQGNNVLVPLYHQASFTSMKSFICRVSQPIGKGAIRKTMCLSCCIAALFHQHKELVWEFINLFVNGFMTSSHNNNENVIKLGSPAPSPQDCFFPLGWLWSYYLQRRGTA